MSKKKSLTTCEGRFSQSRKFLAKELEAIVTEMDAIIGDDEGKPITRPVQTLGRTPYKVSTSDLRTLTWFVGERAADPYFDPDHTTRKGIVDHYFVPRASITHGQHKPIRPKPDSDNLAFYVPLFGKDPDFELDPSLFREYARSLGARGDTAEQLASFAQRYISAKDKLDSAGTERRDLRQIFNTRHFDTVQVKTPTGSVSLRDLGLSADFGIGNVGIDSVTSDAPYIVRVSDKSAQNDESRVAEVFMLAFWYNNKPAEDADNSCPEVIVAQLQEAAGSKVPWKPHFGIVGNAIAEETARLLGAKCVLGYSTARHPAFFVSDPTPSMVEDFKRIYDSSMEFRGWTLRPDNIYELRL